MGRRTTRVGKTKRTIVAVKRIRKKFGRSYYMGKVANFHKTTGYRVIYDDEDEEDLSVDVIEGLVV